jgi:hypothetical protein
MKITVWSWADLRGVGPYTVKLLRSLGYRVSLKQRAGLAYAYAVDDSRTKAQMNDGGSDYPAAWVLQTAPHLFLFLPSLANTNDAEFCDTHRPTVDQAHDKPRTGGTPAFGQWIDRLLTRYPWS